MNQPFGFLMGVLVPLGAVGAIVGHFRGHDLCAEAAAMRWGRMLIALGVVMFVAWTYKILQT